MKLDKEKLKAVLDKLVQYEMDHAKYVVAKDNADKSWQKLVDAIRENGLEDGHQEEIVTEYIIRKGSISKPVLNDVYRAFKMAGVVKKIEAKPEVPLNKRQRLILAATKGEPIGKKEVDKALYIEELAEKGETNRIISVLWLRIDEMFREIQTIVDQNPELSMLKVQARFNAFVGRYIESRNGKGKQTNG